MSIHPPLLFQTTYLRKIIAMIGQPFFLSKHILMTAGKKGITDLKKKKKTFLAILPEDLRVVYGIIVNKKKKIIFVRKLASNIVHKNRYL